MSIYREELLNACREAGKCSEAIEIELTTWTPEQRRLLAEGFELRGIECVVGRWYGPTDSESNGVISPLRQVARATERMMDVLRENHRQVLMSADHAIDPREDGP